MTAKTTQARAMVLHQREERKLSRRRFNLEKVAAQREERIGSVELAMKQGESNFKMFEYRMQAKKADPEITDEQLDTLWPLPKK